MLVLCVSELEGNKSSGTVNMKVSQLVIRGEAFTYVAIHYNLYVINLANYGKDLIEHVVCDARVKITDVKSFTTFVRGHAEVRICKNSLAPENSKRSRQFNDYSCDCLPCRKFPLLCEVFLFRCFDFLAAVKSYKLYNEFFSLLHKMEMISLN